MKFSIPGRADEKRLFWFSLVISIVLETLIAIEIIQDNSITKGIQYTIAFIPIVLCGCSFLVNIQYNRKHYFYFYEMRKGLLLIFALGVLSFSKSFENGKIGLESIRELIQIILPFVYTFFVLNFLKENEIVSFMKIALLFTVIGYLVLIFRSGISLEELSGISVVDSYSPFENHVFAEVASGLCAFFIYNRKKAPVYCFIAIILNFLIFKRVMMLMVVVLLFVSLCNKENDTVSRKIMQLSIVGWSILILVCFTLYLPDNAKIILERTGLDLEKFTMFRIYRLWYCIENHFASYGLGATTEFLREIHQPWLGFEFEMDFIRIVYELGFIAIPVIIYTYMKITRRNYYSYVMISFCFLNLLMANGLVRYWGWTFRLITIALAVYHKQDENRRYQNIYEYQ